MITDTILRYLCCRYMIFWLYSQIGDFNVRCIIYGLYSGIAEWGGGGILLGMRDMLPVVGSWDHNGGSYSPYSRSEFPEGRGRAAL